VGVPVVVAVGIDEHIRHVALHESARQQQTLSDAVVAVALAHGDGLALEVQGLAHPLTGQDLKGLLVLRIDPAGRGVSFESDIQPLKRQAQRLPIV